MTTTFSNLNKLIKKASNVIIMTHKNSDLDALGSTICLSRIITGFNKKNDIVLDKKNNSISIQKALQLIKEANIDINFITKSAAIKKIKKETLLIILDTSKRELVEYPELLDQIPNKVVIDHHVLGNRNIQDTMLSYINSHLSSTNEIMVNYLKFLNKEVEPIIATIMLAGIEVDTNSFNVKTSSATFQAAAHLLDLGASNILKKEILQEEKTQYLKRENLLKKSYIIQEIYAICCIDQLIQKEDLSVIAERMLLFDKVEAAFAIGKLEKDIVAISARSLGNIDVYYLMKKFDGGGHLTDAAAQIKDGNLKEIEKTLIAKLEVLK